MKNVFFNRAFEKAGDITAKKHRLLRLIAQLGMKLQRVNWKTVNIDSARSKASVFGRIGKAYANGQYRDFSVRTILIIVAAIIYFVNPMDLIPDLIPITGLTDDVGVLLWVYSSVKGEIDRFLEWEQAKLSGKLLK